MSRAVSEVLEAEHGEEALSVARDETMDSPRRRAFQVNVHGVHANGDTGACSVAGCHVRRSSVLTSTRTIRPSPDHALPTSGTGPRETKR